MNSNSKPLRISSISDIHCGNKRNDTRFILENLNKHFSNDEHLSKVDMIIIGGDFFDDLLTYPSIDSGLIDIWISKFLKKCHHYNILVRILEGTPSHDRQQSERFRIINSVHCEVSNSNVDLEYVKILSIEHIDRFDIDVLYVPDEWNHDTADTLIEVKDLLKSKNIYKVDFAFVHGCFDYQLANIIKDNIKHNSNEYLAIVKGLIFVGHIHQNSKLDRIHANGSFDRLAHGEEEIKGFLYAIINPDYSYQITFIENYTARTFITIKCPYEDTEQNLKRIDKRVKSLRSGSFIRIESKYNNPIISNLDIVKRRWPLFNWSILPKDKDTNEEVNVFSQDIIYTPIVINKDTIVSLVIDRVGKLNVSPDIMDRCLLHMKDLV